MQADPNVAEEVPTDPHVIADLHGPGAHRAADVGCAHGDQLVHLGRAAAQQVVARHHAAGAVGDQDHLVLARLPKGKIDLLIQILVQIGVVFAPVEGEIEQGDIGLVSHAPEKRVQRLIDRHPRDIPERLANLDVREDVVIPFGRRLPVGLQREGIQIAVLAGERRGDAGIIQPDGLVHGIVMPLRAPAAIIGPDAGAKARVGIRHQRERALCLQRAACQARQEDNRQIGQRRSGQRTHLLPRPQQLAPGYSLHTAGVGRYRESGCPGAVGLDARGGLVHAVEVDGGVAQAARGREVAPGHRDLLALTGHLLGQRDGRQSRVGRERVVQHSQVVAALVAHEYLARHRVHGRAEGSRSGAQGRDHLMGGAVDDADRVGGGVGEEDVAGLAVDRNAAAAVVAAVAHGNAGAVGQPAGGHLVDLDHVDIAVRRARDVQQLLVHVDSQTVGLAARATGLDRLPGMDAQPEVPSMLVTEPLSRWLT